MQGENTPSPYNNNKAQETKYQIKSVLQDITQDIIAISFFFLLCTTVAGGSFKSCFLLEYENEPCLWVSLY